MASYQILYWNEIPTQIRVEDDHDEVSIEMPERFMKKVDELAMARAQSDTDDYLDGWNWSDAKTKPGTAKEIAETLKRELEAKFDF